MKTANIAYDRFQYTEDWRPHRLLADHRAPIILQDHVKCNPKSGELGSDSVISISDIDEEWGIIDEDVDCAGERAVHRSGRTCSRGDLVVCRVEPRRRRVAIMHDESPRRVAGGLTVLRPVSISATVLYFALRSSYATRYLERKATRKRVPEVTNRDLQGMPLTDAMFSPRVERWAEELYGRLRQLALQMNPRHLRSLAQEVMGAAVVGSGTKGRDRFKRVPYHLLIDRLDVGYLLGREPVVPAISTYELGSVANVHLGTGTTGDGSILQVGDVSEQSWWVSQTWAPMSHEFSGTNGLVMGDLLISRMGRSRKIVQYDLDHAVRASPHWVVVSARDVHVEYLLLYLKTDAGLQSLESIWPLGEQAHLSAKDLKRLAIPVLERSAQEEIVNRFRERLDWPQLRAKKCELDREIQQFEETIWGSYAPAQEGADVE